ncbi:MAG: hypothetical protein ACOCV7_02525 [Desulfonatronovibrionaceae bacterium]
MKKIMPFLTVLLLLTGCSYLSVGHLERNLFQLNQNEQLDMRYWNFEYKTTVENGKYTVAGRALPKMKAVPGWGEWLHDFWLSVYLSDKQGTVLASDLEIYPTMELDADNGVEFSFTMEPDQMPVSKETYLTFGYRMSLTEGRYQSPDTDSPLTTRKSVFFASEGALAR